MNIIQAKIIIKDFEDYINKLKESEENNTLGDFSILPHNVSEILLACDVQIEYFETILDSKNDLKVNEIEHLKHIKETLFHVFGNK